MMRGEAGGKTGRVCRWLRYRWVKNRLTQKAVGMKDDQLRLDLARKSYEEVLDATKHQDDKIGRFLTAIAFLFTGAIAFGARPEIIGIRVGVAATPVALPEIFLGVFLALSVIAVLLLLVGLGPNLNLPSPEREYGPPSR